MATHVIHEEKDCFYFVTITCYKWLPLLEKSNIYDYLHRWFDNLYKRGILLNGYVIMPNHIHLLVFVKEECKGMNFVFGEAKRFLAYEIVERLRQMGSLKLLKKLQDGVQEREKKKGKKHQVFRLLDFHLMRRT